jgi:hypothetical protein
VLYDTFTVTYEQAFIVIMQAFFRHCVGLFCFTPSQCLHSIFFSLSSLTLPFSSKMLVKTKYKKKHLLNGKEKISVPLEKATVCVNLGFTLRKTPYF